MTFRLLARTCRPRGIFTLASFVALSGAFAFGALGAAGSARAASAPSSSMSAPGTPIAPSAVEIAAADGLKIHGTYYAASGNGPIVLMLHQCNKDRTSWEPLGRAFAASGIHALAFDFRGIGESQNADNDSFPQYHDALWTSYPDDVDRMMKFLRTLPDVDADRVGVVGSACGGSQTLLLALRDSKVKALCFFSTALPWISGTDFTQFTLNRSMPMLMISSEGDREAPKKSRMLFDEARDPMSKLIQYKGEQHGTELFNQDPGLVDSIARWFGTVL